MTQKSPPSTAALWARFRFSVVGSLLSSPPARGELKAAIRCLAAKTWTHPVTGRDVRFAAVTIERWYYTARREKDDPVGVLRRAVRKDCGKVSLAPALAEHLFNQYHDHKHWSYQLHYDNLVARVQADPSLGPLRSYSTIRRYMKTHGLVRKPRPQPKGRPGEALAVARRQTREIRSYEAEYVGSLWHLDFHHGSLKVLTDRGKWQRPIVLGILDDHSRLCCHLQWYLSETAEDLVHGLSQAIQKRGLPRALLTDNGPAMVADEVTEGLLRLGIVHERTLPYSPYQNGKQESFWATLEGRLMEMLNGFADLTLDFLNEATQAWVEIEYNRRVHRETSRSPVERFVGAPDVLRSSPSSNALREAFRLETRRRHPITAAPTNTNFIFQAAPKNRPTRGHRYCQCPQSENISSIISIDRVSIVLPTLTIDNKVEDDAEVIQEEITYRRSKRTKSDRFPESLPRQVQTINLPEADRKCSCCGEGTCARGSPVPTAFAPKGCPPDHANREVRSSPR